MESSNRRIVLWAVITTVLSFVFAIGVATETPQSRAFSLRIGVGWSEVGGPLLNIKCENAEPAEITRRGIPFAYQETEVYCSGENEVHASRTNMVALFLNVVVAGSIAAVGINISNYARRNSG